MAAIVPKGMTARRLMLEASRAIVLLYNEFLAERVGFEPTVAINHTAFRERHLQPLGHLSGSVEYRGEPRTARSGGRGVASPLPVLPATTARADGRADQPEDREDECDPPEDVERETEPEQQGGEEEEGEQDAHDGGSP